MITLMLWQALVHPARWKHPLTHYIARRGACVLAPGSVALILGALLSVTVAFFFRAGALSMRMIDSVLVTYLPYWLAIQASSNFGNGLASAMAVAGGVHEQDPNTFDLMCLAPQGPVQAVWAISVGSLHCGKTNPEDRLIALIITVAWTAAIAVTAATMVLPGGFLLPAYLVVLGAFFVDYVQTTVLGAQYGLLIAHYVTNNVNSLLISIYMAGYLLLTMIASAPAIFGYFRGWSPDMLVIAWAFFGAIIRLLLRERLIRVLWWVIRHQLNADDIELSDMLLSSTYPEPTL